MFWAVFVDGGGVLGCVVHVLGGIVDGDGVLRQVLGLGFGVCLEEGLF